MAGDKQKPEENPNGQSENTPDVLKLGEVKMPEKAPEIAAEKTDVKKEATKETSEIKREVLQMEVNPDKDTPSKIDRLNVEEGLESKEQKESFDLLQTVTGTTLLAMLFESGTTKEALKNIESLKNIGRATLEKLNPAEKISLKKLQEIASKPDSKIYAVLKERWSRLVERGHEIYESAHKTKEALSAPTQQPGKYPGATVEKEPTTFWEKITGFAKEHPILTAGIAAAGAYGVYKIFKWFTSSDEDEEQGNGEKKEGFIDKILGDKWGKRLKWGLGISAGIFVLGRLIGNEDVSKWLKDKLGINITGNRLSQFLIHLSHGEFVEAFKVLFAGPDENFEIHRHMAEKISQEMGGTVDPETLKGIGNIKYSDFMSTIAEGKSAIAGVLGQIPGLNLIVGSASTAEQEEIIRKYFEAHQEEISHFVNPTTTVDDVLKNLSGEAVSTEPPAPEVASIDDAISKLPPEQQEMGKELKLDLQKLMNEKSVLSIISEAKKLNIDTKKITELYREWKNALKDLNNSIANKESTESIAEKADRVFKTNVALGDEYNDLRDQIMKRRGWTELELLSATHAPKAIGWLLLPEWKKEYGKYIVSKYLKAPIKTATELINKAKGISPESGLIGREFKTNATPSEVDQDIKNNEEELTRAKKSLEIAEKQPKIKSTEEITREIEHNKAKVALLEKDQQIHGYRKTIAEQEAKIAELKSKRISTGPEITKAEEIIKENQSTMRAFIKERVELQGNYLVYEMAERKAVFTNKFGPEGEKGVLTKTYLDQMDTLQNTIDAHRKQINLQMADKMAEMEKLAKEGKDIKGIAREYNDLMKEKIRIDLGDFTTYKSLAQKFTTEWKLRKAMKGKGAATPEIEQIAKQEKNQMQQLFYKVLNKQSEKEGILKSVTNITRGKLLLYGGFIALGTAINFKDRNASEEFSKALSNALGQSVVDTVPFISTYSNFYSAFTGEEMVTGRKLDKTDRTLRAAFGVGSGLCDASTMAGTFMRLKAAKAIMQEASETGKSMEMGQALKKAGNEIEDLEALRDISKSGHWVNKLAMGGALGAMGYALIMQPVASVEITPEIKDIMGDQIHDTDIEPPKIDHPLVQAP